MLLGGCSPESMKTRFEHLYLRVLAIIVIMNFITFLETGLQIGIRGFVGNTGNIWLIRSGNY